MRRETSLPSAGSRQHPITVHDGTGASGWAAPDERRRCHSSYRRLAAMVARFRVGCRPCTCDGRPIPGGLPSVHRPPPAVLRRSEGDDRAALAAIEEDVMGELVVNVCTSLDTSGGHQRGVGGYDECSLRATRPKSAEVLGSVNVEIHWATTWLWAEWRLAGSEVRTSGYRVLVAGPLSLAGHRREGRRQGSGRANSQQGCPRPKVQEDVQAAREGAWAGRSGNG